ncbi:hypothetical protein AMATHDRAFT_63527 [Amanita thiersii Skay4041]|uniref:Uncharacterized protein n=1 Tax=Amanita thiersii Skay4041 TaxID=703135 RepID=A0A2A9NNK0_9AGAR|nr:hypothetical protein AMATHDRAFT_63527 [Amanita thiersii Skay4041]
MLASKTETPRPRPPAKARRSTSTNRVLTASASSPPPSYADSFAISANRSLPYSTTEEVLVRKGKEDVDELASDDAWGFHSRHHNDDDDEGREGMDDGGAEEPMSPELVLSEILDKADDIFRERRNDEVSSMTAAARSLYEENVALRNKHNTLAGHMTQPDSPPSMDSPLPTMPLFTTPSRYNYTYSHSTPERLSDLSRPFIRRGHVQRISMSGADVAYLADQNAELLEKLEKLEYESTHADQSGRRQLKRLEKEIADLREELEKTQARSEELEEKTKHGWNSEQVINAVAKKKLEREAKMRALRNLGHSGGSSEETEVKSFAPEGSSFGGPSSGYSFMTPSHPNARMQASSVNLPRQIEEAVGMRAVTAPFPANPSPRQKMSAPANADISEERPEITLINQLMEKMVELQEANTRIIEQQVETTKQLQAFQRETEQMNKAYQSLGEPFQVEDLSDSEHNASESTKFYSFSQGADRRLRTGQAGKFGAARHRRRTLGSGDVKDAKSANERLTASTSKLNLPVPFPPSPNLSRHRSCTSLHNAFASPALSSLSLDDHLEPSPSLPTLQSELGKAFSEDMGEGSNFHLRTTSIFTMPSQPLSSISLPPSPSPSPGRLQARRAATSAAGNKDEPDMPGPPTPMSLAPRGNSLQLHPQEAPRTPVMDLLRPLEVNSSGLQSPRYYRMSQTVRSRTDRWVRGRFGNSLIGVVEDVMSEPPPPPPAPLGVSQRLAQAFESVVEGFTGSGSDPAGGSDDGVGSSTPSSRRSSVSTVYEDATSLSPSPPDRAATGIKKERQGIGKVVLELWLWLQFVVIIFVFLWAMARRGPKSVLFEGADGKKGVTVRR